MINFNKIKEIRNRAGISQSELAFRIGSNQGYICDIENGKAPHTSFEIISKISVVLSCDMSEFIETSMQK